MKLFEHPDFQQAILAAAEHFRGQGLRPAIIEKDYYVTESLRIVAQICARIQQDGEKCRRPNTKPLVPFPPCRWPLARYRENRDRADSPLRHPKPLGATSIGG